MNLPTNQTPSNALDLKARKRRFYELWAALGLLLLVLAGTWIQLTYYGVDSWIFLALLNVNALFLLVVLFLVARNVIKLILERRRKVFGYKLRTRLVVVFVSLSLIPTVIMFLASNRVVATSVDYWFTRHTESSLQAALDVGQSFYVTAATRLQARSESIIQTVPVTDWASPELLQVFLDNKKKEYGLVMVGFVNAAAEEQVFSSSEFDGIWKKTKERINWQHVIDNTFGSLLWATDDADYVVGVTAIAKGHIGYLIAVESIGQGLLAKLERISNGFEEYAQLKQLKKPLRVSFLMILGVLGMFTIFGCIWFGFRLSKEITAPILALAEGTTRVAQGDLDFRLEDRGEDELGLLVQSFNKMAKDLKQSRASLTKANTQLAEHNRYIETVLDNITTGVITLDPTGQIVTINQAACNIFDTKANRLEGLNPMVFLNQEHAEIFHYMLETLRRHPEKHWQKQVDFIFQGRTWKLLVNTVALTSKSNPAEIVAYVVVIEDITELEKMQKMSAWREVAKRIAHEIKNPLTPIKLSAQRLQRKFGSLTQDSAFNLCTDLIIKQTERLQDLVQEFSSFAKLPEVNLQPGNLMPILQELVNLFANSHSRIAWKLDLPPTLPPMSLDNAALHRAILNILTNAAEALINTKQPQVVITANYDESKDFLSLSINDNGPGLSPEEKEKIFEPYFSGKKSGTGLGLVIVKSIIADHHGFIRIFSTAGTSGTTVTLEFPVLSKA